jgi:hypothetical protein
MLESRVARPPPSACRSSRRSNEPPPQRISVRPRRRRHEPRPTRPTRAPLAPPTTLLRRRRPRRRRRRRRSRCRSIYARRATNGASELAVTAAQMPHSGGGVAACTGRGLTPTAALEAAVARLDGRCVAGYAWGGSERVLLLLYGVGSHGGGCMSAWAHAMACGLSLVAGEHTRRGTHQWHVCGGMCCEHVWRGGM